MEKGTCKLCEQDKMLCNSHIISEFLYKHTYDESHRFMSLVDNPRMKTRPTQKGYREYLLCRGCEDQLNNYEDYVADLLANIHNKKTDGDQIQVKEYDYQKLKLFSLSLIWRSHVASIPGFKTISLGPHAEPIKSMLKNENPDPPKKYCLFIQKIEGPESSKKILTVPFRKKFVNLNAMCFFALGFRWIIITSNQYSKIPDNCGFVGDQNHLEIGLLKISEKEFLKYFKPAFDRIDN